MSTFDSRYVDHPDGRGLDDVNALTMELDALEALGRLRAVAGFLRGLAATDADRWSALYAQDWAESADDLINIADSLRELAREALEAQQ
ncbi:hypothetical protein [Corynebacterium xerosis]|uniref:hypothetical protein n=1 Tax=Corynebacterium xerosis TaxID=1725 RepID=UPI00367111F1